MGLRIRTNIASESIQKNLKEVSKKAGDQLEKISSGKRITKSADDAAGLAIATNLKAQNRGLRQATRNASDGISLVQVAEGGLNEVSNILVRLRELTIQAASDTVGDNERSIIDHEYQQLVQEVDRISQTTNFNGTSLLAGEGSGTMNFHVGASSAESNIIKFDSDKTNVSADNIGIAGTGASDRSDALSSIDSVDEAINVVSKQRSELGAIQSRLQSTMSNLEVQSLNQEGARAGIEDVDIASASAKLAASNVLKTAGVAALVQANNIPNSALRLIS